jgi:hypothetical protein
LLDFDAPPHLTSRPCVCVCVCLSVSVSVCLCLSCPVPQVYASSDIHVSASEFETLGNTVLEAFSCAIPVVVPRTQVLHALPPNPALYVTLFDVLCYTRIYSYHI